MTNNGKIDMTKRQGLHYTYLLANMDRLRVLGFLKNGPQSWQETFNHLAGDVLRNNGWFAHILDGMREDMLIISQYDLKEKKTMIAATAYGLEKLRQTKEEIGQL